MVWFQLSMAATMGPTSPPWGPVSHPHWSHLGPWLTPYLALRRTGVIPQELVAHLITVGNAWPFLQEEEEEEDEEEEGQKEEGRKRGEQKEKTSGEIWLSTVVDAKTQQAFLKHESPLMELGDKPNQTWRVCICVCLPLQHMYQQQSSVQGLCLCLLPRWSTLPHALMPQRWWQRAPTTHTYTLCPLKQIQFEG